MTLLYSSIDMHHLKWLSMTVPGRDSVPTAHGGGYVHFLSDVPEGNLWTPCPSNAKKTTHPGVSQSLWRNLQLTSLQEQYGGSLKN